MRMTTSGGSVRATSTNITIGTLTRRERRLRTSASARPSDMPATTTSAAISIVTTMPLRMSGR
jgi:hypothetical protein